MLLNEAQFSFLKKKYEYAPQKRFKVRSKVRNSNGTRIILRLIQSKLRFFTIRSNKSLKFSDKRCVKRQVFIYYSTVLEYCRTFEALASSFSQKHQLHLQLLTSADFVVTSSQNYDSRTASTVSTPSAWNGETSRVVSISLQSHL